MAVLGFKIPPSAAGDGSWWEKVLAFCCGPPQAPSEVPLFHGLVLGGAAIGCRPQVANFTCSLWVAEFTLSASARDGLFWSANERGSDGP